MKIVDLELAGLKLVQPDVYGDARGFFIETYSLAKYAAGGIDVPFVQDNHSRSIKHTLRGLHYQSRPGQAKLVRVVVGRIYDVAVDIRPRSPTFGRWVGVELDSEKHEQLFVPVGFAHGFCVLSDVAEVVYKVSAPYDAATECGLGWNDPELGVKWPVAAPLLSKRDEQGESFAAYRARVTS